MRLDYRGSEEAFQGLSPGVLLSLEKRGGDSKEGGSQESKRKTRNTGCAGNQIKKIFQGRESAKCCQLIK